MLLCAPTAGMPFGGIKDSGYGRECSDFGIYQFVYVTSVLVQD